MKEYNTIYKISVFNNYISSSYFGRKWYLNIFVRDNLCFYLSHYTSIRSKIVNEELMLSEAL